MVLKTVGVGSQEMFAHTPNGVKFVGKVTGKYAQSLLQYVNKNFKGDLTEIIKSYKPGDGEYIAKIYSGHLKGDERYSHALTVVDVLHANGLVTKAVAKQMEQELANSLARLRKSRSENVNEGKFKVDDLVYNKKTKTVGIVRMGDDKYGEVKTDADGNVNVDELEKYNPIKHKHQENAKVAPSTEKEVNTRGLFNPFKMETVNEGNAFGMAVSAAKKEGLKEFEFNGKMYKVKTGSYEKNEAAKKPVVLSGFTLVPEKKK